MSTLSRFFGIVIRMYHDDHAPPHFHAVYGDEDVSIRIDTLEVLEGRFSRRGLRLVKEWAAAHQGELTEDWARAERHEALLPIDPLD